MTLSRLCTRIIPDAWHPRNPVKTFHYNTRIVRIVWNDVQPEETSVINPNELQSIRNVDCNVFTAQYAAWCRFAYDMTSTTARQHRFLLLPSVIDDGHPNTGSDQDEFLGFFIVISFFFTVCGIKCRFFKPIA